jgi:hypothetical protein
MYRYYDFQSDVSAGIALEFQAFSSHFMTRGCQTDPHDEQLYPLISISQQKIRQFFALLDFIDKEFRKFSLPGDSHTMVDKILCFLEA